MRNTLFIHAGKTKRVMRATLEGKKTEAAFQLSAASHAASPTTKRCKHTQILRPQAASGPSSFHQLSKHVVWLHELLQYKALHNLLRTLIQQHPANICILAEV